MKEYVVVNFSGGKDSTAMLLRLMDLGEHIDEVVCCDTYKEFPEMYKHIERVRQLVEDKDIHFTTLKSKHTFDYWMFEKPVNGRGVNKSRKGYSWATSRARWCTSRLKIDVMNNYFKSLNEKYSVVRYIGIAADETKRLLRANSKRDNIKHPLVEWGWTEKDCLKYCYDNGFDWGGLYEFFDRVSCWCCPLQSLGELRKLRKHFPDLWEELKEMDGKTWLQFKSDYSVEDLEKRFEFEERCLLEGLSITNKEFYKKLKEVITGDEK